jgi:hypothetical protein
MISVSCVWVPSCAHTTCLSYYDSNLDAQISATSIEDGLPRDAMYRLLKESAHEIVNHTRLKCGFVIDFVKVKHFEEHGFAHAHSGRRSWGSR